MAAVDFSAGTWYIEGRIDTRSHDETGKAIPGSGEVYNCDCCGREHEVWVHVRSKSSAGIVGTSCAKKAGNIHNRHLLGSNYTTTKRNGVYMYQQEMAIFRSI